MEGPLTYPGRFSWVSPTGHDNRTIPTNMNGKLQNAPQTRLQIPITTNTNRYQNHGYTQWTDRTTLFRYTSCGCRHVRKSMIPDLRSARSKIHGNCGFWILSTIFFCRETLKILNPAWKFCRCILGILDFGQNVCRWILWTLDLGKPFVVGLCGSWILCIMDVMDFKSHCCVYLFNWWWKHLQN